MNIEPQEVTSLPYLLGHHPADAQGNSKALNWKDVPVGTAYIVMFAGLVQMTNGYQGQSFVTGEALYIPDTVNDPSEVPAHGIPVVLPMNSVLTGAVVKDRTIEVGRVYRITYIGRVNAKGVAVNYDNFKIEAYNSPELDKFAQDTWVAKGRPALPLGVTYSLTPDPVNKGDLLVVNGQVEDSSTPAPVAPAIPTAPVAPVAPAPVAPAPVAPVAPVAPAIPTAPVAPAIPTAPVAPVAPAPVAPAPVAPAPVAPTIPTAPVAPAIPTAPVAPAPVAPAIPAPPIAPSLTPQ